MIPDNRRLFIYHLTAKEIDVVKTALFDSKRKMKGKVKNEEIAEARNAYLDYIETLSGLLTRFGEKPE